MSTFMFQCLAKLSRIATRIESRRLEEHRETAIEELDTCIRGLPNLYTLPTRLRNKGFTWQQDPWRGYLDYVSEPWVTWHKQGGDCDDMARLYLYAFQKFHEGGNESTGYPNACCASIMRLRLFRKPAGHAVFIETTDAGLRVFTNLEVWHPANFPAPSDAPPGDDLYRAAGDFFVAGWTHMFFYDEYLNIAHCIKQRKGTRDNPRDSR